MKDKLDLTFLIPCLNEEGTITRAVEAAFKAGEKAGVKKFEIVVADNGSKDESLKKVIKQKIARLVRVPVRGYGAALHWGILHARGEYILFADADLSYDFSEAPKFLKFRHRNYDLVLGSRMRGRIEKGAMPFLNRHLGTPFLTWLIRRMYHLKTTDCNSGMRLIRKAFYKTLHMRNSGMEWASELLLKTALAKGKYGEVPITFFKDKRGKSTHLLRWTDGWRHLKAIVLVKPNFLFFPLVGLIGLTLLFSERFLDLTFFFGLLTGSLFLSILAAKMLNYAIDNKASRMINLMNKLPLVRFAILATLSSFILLIVISKEYLGAKLFLVSAVAIFNIWVFLIETIKTHLVNTLPENV